MYMQFAGTCIMCLYIHWQKATSCTCSDVATWQLTFSLKRRKNEPSQLVLLCCLALFIVSPLFNHVFPHYKDTGGVSHAGNMCAETATWSYQKCMNW